MKKKSKIEVIELSNGFKIRVIRQKEKVNKKVEGLNMIKKFISKRALVMLLAISLSLGFARVAYVANAFNEEVMATIPTRTFTSEKQILNVKSSVEIKEIEVVAPVEESIVEVAPIVKEVVVPIVKEVVVPNIDEVFIYNDKLPMPREHQEYLYNLCKERNLDYLKTLAVLKHESQFDVNSVNAGGDYGYMQVNKVNHKDLTSKLKTPNKPLDAYVNMNWGTHLLKEAYSYWENKGLSGINLEESALSTYNKGLGGFKKHGKAVSYIGKVNNELTFIETAFAN